MCLIERKENRAKNLLREYIPLLNHVKALRREIERNYSGATSVTMRYKPINVQGGGSVFDRMAEQVCENIDAEKALYAEIERLNAKTALIIEAIRSAKTEIGQTVLTMRYINGRSWTEIKRALNYEERYVFIIHGRALADVNEWMEGRKI